MKEQMGCLRDVKQRVLLAFLLINRTPRERIFRLLSGVHNNVVGRGRKSKGKVKTKALYKKK